MAAAELSMQGSKCQNPVTARPFILGRASRATTKRVNGLKMAWSTDKNAIFGLKTADLNGGFRPIVVGTRVIAA
jgi:hypothetical protein